MMSPEYALLLLLVAEGVALYLGQRQIFGSSLQLLGKFPAYFLAVPGTVLHELAHYFACKLLGVPTGKISLFKPVQGKDGSITLGYVMHAESDPLRSALIAIAPLLLVPPLLLGVTVVLLGGGVLHDPLGALSSSAWWRVIVWLYISLSAGQGAFPSVGDHIGGPGFVALALLVVCLVWVLPLSALLGLYQGLTIILALPAAMAALSLVVLRWMHQRN